MSTKKDGANTSTMRKVIQNSSELAKKVREDSTDRRHTKKVEDSTKKTTTVIKQKSVDTNRTQPMKSESKRKSVTVRSSEKEKSEVKRDSQKLSSKVSKDKFFPDSKTMISNALRASDTEVPKSSRTKPKIKVESQTMKPKTNSDRSSQKVTGVASKNNITDTKSVSHISSRRDEKEVKGKTSSSSMRSKTKNATTLKNKSLESVSSRNEVKSFTNVESGARDSSDYSTTSERPGTATLRKGSLVNTNIVGPEVPEELVPKLVKEHSMLLKPFEFSKASKSKVTTKSKAKAESSDSIRTSKAEPKTSSTSSRHNSRNNTKLKTDLTEGSTISESNLKPPLSCAKSDSPDDYDYEDDFNSYESDFEKYSSSSTDLNVDDITGGDTSSISSSESHLSDPLELKSATKRVSSAVTEEDKKMDSGHYDMPDYKHKQILDNIKESVEKENANLDVQRNNAASLSDEGFEDQKSLQFINFLDAQKKTIRRRSMEIRRKRGEDILSMIKLDSFSYTLFDLRPVPYEVFMKNYGRSNTVQSATQTGDDNIDEEIQTDKIALSSKWTQIPVCFSKLNPDDPSFWRIYKNEYLGVGSEHDGESNSVNKMCNEHYLNKFLMSAGTLVTKVLEERSSDNLSNLKKNSRDLPFSDGYISFNTTNVILRGSSVDHVSFSCDNNRKFATVHTRKDKNLYAIAIWRAYSEDPELVLESYSAISSCSIDFTSRFVYGGLHNGTILIWNTSLVSKDSSSHAPVHCTNVGFGHSTKIVAINNLKDSTDSDSFLSKGSTTKEICSLDEDGEIILWGVVVKQNSAKTFESDSKEVTLVKNSCLSLKTVHPDFHDLVCTDLVLDISNNNYAYISTNYGFILHYLIKGGSNTVKTFQPGTDSSANCLEACPFSPNYLLAGFTNGNVNLYSRLIDNPLMILSDKESRVSSSCVQLIQWSKTRPFVIYVKDSANSIHIWDLNESDIFPIYSIPFQKTITCLKLSPAVDGSEDNRAFLVIGTDDGSLYMHHLSEEHGNQPKSTYEEDIKTFLNYVSRL
nr:unnamed protein product [Callosobruchus chinensis]